MEENIPAPKIQKTEEEWKKQLDKQEFDVCRLKNTEEPFLDNSLFYCEKDGYYTCKCCNSELFISQNKFKSTSGWPSFSKPASKNSIHLVRDIWQTEVICSSCHSHLGHVFYQQEESPNGKRFCINSTSLHFREIKK
eukprot:gene6067-10075_t